MKRLRYLFAMALGAAVTLGLLVLMDALIATGELELDESDSVKMADITMPETRIETNVREQKPQKIEDPEEPPPRHAPEVQDFSSGGTRMMVGMAATPAQQVQISTGIGAAASDGAYVPIVMVAPIYPRRALKRGIEGYCIVEYTVTTTGATRDPVAIDCSPAGMWEDASVKAALKFKYKPRAIDGEPVEVAGVRNRFLFEIEE
jgi:periplasmic protein TonB